jgi:hypothetical protein
VLIVTSMMKNTYPNLRWNPGFQRLAATRRHDERKRKKAIESCDRAASESSWLSGSRTSICQIDDIGPLVSTIYYISDTSIF